MEFCFTLGITCYGIIVQKKKQNTASVCLQSTIKHNKFGEGAIMAYTKHIETNTCY